MKMFRCFIRMRFDICMVLYTSLSGYFIIQLATTSNYSYLYPIFLFLSLAGYCIFKSLQLHKEERKKKGMDECISTYRRVPVPITTEQTMEPVPTPEERLATEQERTYCLKEMLASEKEITKRLRERVNKLEKSLDIDSNNNTEKNVHQRRLESI